MKHVEKRVVLYLLIAPMAALAVFNQPLPFLAVAVAAGIVAAWGNVPKVRILPRKSDFAGLKKKIYNPKIPSMTERRVAKETKIGKVHGILKVESISPDTIMTMASVFLKMKMARSLERWMVSMIKTAIFESGAMENSRKIAHYSISLAFLTLPPTLLAGVLLGIFLSPVFFSIAGVPAGFLMSGVINLKMVKMQRKSAIEHELPVFIMCASIMEKVGFNLYVFLDRLSHTNTSLFPTVQKDAKLFTRNTTFLAMSHEKALKKIANRHPNQQFKDLVNDYTSARTTSGASTVNTMQSATDSAFRSMRFKIKAYAGTAQGVAQMLLLMMATAPIMTIASSLLSSGDTAFQMTMMMLVMMPMMSIMIILMVDGKQPQTYNTAKLAREGIVIAIICGVVMAAIGRPAWEILGVSMAMFAGINAFKTMGHFRKLARLDKSMPGFLQEVTDGMNEGMSIYENIKRNANHENKALREMLSIIARKMYMGKSLVDASEESKMQSWLSHVVMFVLGHVHESGAASAHTLQEFTNFTRDYQESKQELLASLRSVVGLGYFIPVLMGFMLVVSLQLVTTIAGDLGEVEGLPISLPSVSNTEDLSNASFLLVVVCSSLIGLVVSKIAFFTLKHTLHVCTMSIVAVAICHAVPFVPPFF